MTNRMEELGRLILPNLAFHESGEHWIWVPSDVQMTWGWFTLAVRGNKVRGARGVGWTCGIKRCGLLCVSLCFMSVISLYSASGLHTISTSQGGYLLCECWTWIKSQSLPRWTIPRNPRRVWEDTSWFQIHHCQTRQRNKAPCTCCTHQESRYSSKAHTWFHFPRHPVLRVGMRRPHVAPSSILPHLPASPTAAILDRIQCRAVIPCVCRQGRHHSLHARIIDGYLACHVYYDAVPLLSDSFNFSEPLDLSLSIKHSAMSLWAYGLAVLMFPGYRVYIFTLYSEFAPSEITALLDLKSAHANTSRLRRYRCAL